MSGPVLAFSKPQRPPRRKREKLSPLMRKMETLERLRPGAYRVIDQLVDDLLSEVGIRSPVA